MYSSQQISSTLEHTHATITLVVACMTLDKRCRFSFYVSRLRQGNELKPANTHERTILSETQDHLYTKPKNNTLVWSASEKICYEPFKKWDQSNKPYTLGQSPVFVVIVVVVGTRDRDVCVLCLGFGSEPEAVRSRLVVDVCNQSLTQIIAPPT